jgi:benzodiazapine receptor
MSSQRWLILLAFIAVTFIAAALGGAATNTSINSWYPTLAKPSWNPPAWVFGPVWSALYVLMAIAAWRVWRHVEHPGRRRALAWYFGQLALNALWPLLFFGLRQPGWAFAEILVLGAILVVVLVKFAQIDPPRRVALAAVCGVGRFRGRTQRHGVVA